MDSNCSSCNNSFEAEDDSEKYCADCATQEEVQESQEYEAPVIVESLNNSDSTSNGMGFCGSFGELEQNLFADEEGSKVVARVITRMRLEGYQEDAWKIVMGLTAFAYKNLNCKGYSVEQMRKEISNAPLRELTEFIPGNVAELTEKITTTEMVLNGESKKESNNYNDLFAMGGLVALTFAFAFASRRK